MNFLANIMLFLVLSLTLLSPLHAAEQAPALPGSLQSRDSIQQTCGGPINVKDSLVLSTVTLCLPGILEKTNEFKQNKCEKAVCYYEAVKNNLDPSFCEKQYAYRTCTYIVGEIFAIPPMAMLEYWRNMIAQVLANPVGYLYSAAVKYARKDIAASCTNPVTCNVVKNPKLGASVVLVLVTDVASLAQYFKDLIDNGLDTFKLNSNPDYCEQLGDIREEMEKILAAKNG